MAHPMPLSARDLYEFRPNAAAVIAARAEVEKAQAELDSVQALHAQHQGDGGAMVAHECHEIDVKGARDRLEAAQKALDEAEAACSAADPAFLLKIPTGRTKALLQHAVNTDPDIPAFRGNKVLLAAIESEAEAAGLTADDLTAINEARKVVESGEGLTGDLWSKIYNMAQATETGRALIADRLLHVELVGRHRVRLHLVLDGKRSPLSERDLDEPGVADYLSAINAKLIELSEVSKAAAKNSAAP